MNFTKSNKYNSNYSAQIINITAFEPHPNPEVTKMKVAHVNGCKILVGIDCQPGYYLYFPAGCQVNKEFLSVNNLFKHSELNKDKEKKGYIEDNGRIKMLKLKDFLSEGLILELESLVNWTGEVLENPSNEDFDTVNKVLLCKKYIIEVKHSNYKSIKTNKSKCINIPDGQFRFHYETQQLKKTPWIIKKNTLLHISSKWHGTSGISANIICYKPISKIHKWLNKLNIIPGIHYSYTPDTEYHDVWASRKVIKTPLYNENVTEGFYGVDIWKIAHDIVKDRLEKGMTLYYEIVGYLPNGEAIQKVGGVPYDYGCYPPIEDSKYEYKSNFDIRIYRITYTNIDGKVYEFTARQVQNWCKKHDLSPVIEYYYGFAKDLYSIPEDIDDINFGEWFLEHLTQDKIFNMEAYSSECRNTVYHEGIVLRLEDEDIAYKVKCLKFLDKELKDLDKGKSNIEDEQSQE